MPLMEVGRLKAIQDPSGKGRAVWIVPINLPTKSLPRRKAGFLLPTQLGDSHP